MQALEQLVADGRIARGLPATATTDWGLQTFAGSLAELQDTSRCCALTLTAQLILEAQQQQEIAAWITGTASSVFPPDLAAVGVDLAALPIVRAGDFIMMIEAAEVLLRSGAFGVIVIDFAGRCRPLPLPLQKRLSGLARCHHCAVICLAPMDEQVLGCLASIRAQAAHRREGRRFHCCASMVKDRRRRPHWSHTEVCDGPEGL